MSAQLCYPSALEDARFQFGGFVVAGGDQLPGVRLQSSLSRLARKIALPGSAVLLPFSRSEMKLTLEQKKGIQILEAGETKSYSYEIEFHRG